MTIKRCLFLKFCEDLGLLILSGTLRERKKSGMIWVTCALSHPFFHNLYRHKRHNPPINMFKSIGTYGYISHIIDRGIQINSTSITNFYTHELSSLKIDD